METLITVVNIVVILIIFGWMIFMSVSSILTMSNFVGRRFGRRWGVFSGVLASVLVASLWACLIMILEGILVFSVLVAIIGIMEA